MRATYRPGSTCDWQSSRSSCADGGRGHRAGEVLGLGTGGYRQAWEDRVEGVKTPFFPLCVGGRGG